MRLIYLLIPLTGLFSKSKGDIARTASAIIWVTLGVMFLMASSYTNWKGMQAFFVDFPSIVQAMSKVIACSLDLLASLFFVMAYLNWNKLNLIFEDESIKALFTHYPTHKARYIRSTKALIWLFGLFTVGCIFLTYSLSIYGGSEWANTRAEQEYKPEAYASSVSELLKNEREERGEALANYNSRIREQIAEAKERRAEVMKKDEYARRGRWTKHTYALESEAWLRKHEKFLKREKSLLEKDRAAIAAKYNSMRDKHDIGHEEQKNRFKDMRERLEQITEWGVNFWSIANILIFITSCLLTQQDFLKEAGNEINGWVASVREIDEQTKREATLIIRNGKSIPIKKVDNKEAVESSQSTATPLTPPAGSQNTRRGDKKPESMTIEELKDTYEKCLKEKNNMVRIVEEYYLPEDSTYSITKLLDHFGHNFENSSRSTLHKVINLCRAYRDRVASDAIEA